MLYKFNEGSRGELGKDGVRWLEVRTAPIWQVVRLVLPPSLH